MEHCILVLKYLDLGALRKTKDKIFDDAFVFFSDPSIRSFITLGRNKKIYFNISGTFNYNLMGGIDEPHFSYYALLLQNNIKIFMKMMVKDTLSRREGITRLCFHVFL